MVDPNGTAAAGKRRGDPSGYRFRRGPLGGMLDVPEGYFVCGLYDARNRRCLVRANTEADMERAVDQGAMLGREMIERREAMMERIGMKPTGAPSMASRRSYTPGTSIIRVEGSGKSEVRKLIDCLQEVHEETLTETSCYDLESALERCTR
jgi:methyl coenzyme M reductase gamma subunit